MKNTLFLLTAVFFLSACSPRDPDVLTKADHDMIQSRSKSGKFSRDNSGRAKLPQKVELAMGVLAEGRALQAQQILGLAIRLAATKEGVSTQGCIRSLLTEDKGSERKYQISFNQCHTGDDVSEASFEGVAELAVQLSEQAQIERLNYASHPISDSDVDTNTIQVFKKNAKDSLLVKDAFTLSMNRTPAGYAMLGSSQTVLQSGFMESLTTTNLAIHLDGLISETEILSWHSEVLGNAQNMSSNTSNPATFSMVLNSQKDPGECQYSLRFGKSIRGGLLKFNESDVTITARNDKSKKDDKVTVSRKKSSSLEGVLPWDFWL